MGKEKFFRWHRLGLIVIAGIVALAAGILLIAHPFSEETSDWEAQEVYLLVDADFDPSSIEQLLEAYSNYRADSLRETKAATVLGQELLDGTVSLSRGKTAVRLTDLLSSEVISEEERRQELIAEMEWSTGRNIIESTWESTIVSQQGSQALIYLKCDIKTIYQYVPSSDGAADAEKISSDEFVTQHTITLQKSDIGYRLIADAYEEQATGMRSASYVNTAR